MREKGIVREMERGRIGKIKGSEKLEKVNEGWRMNKEGSGRKLRKKMYG